MSYDLEIATRERPTQAALVEALAGEDVEFEGSLDDGWVAVSRRRARQQPSFTIDGPMEVEPEDLSPELLEVILLPRWLLRMNLPVSRTEADLRFAWKVSRSLTEGLAGGVYDPQSEEVWPRVRSRIPTSSTEEPVQIIELRWFYPARRGDDPELPRTLLEVLRVRCPEAMPRRFGHWNPLSFRLEREGPDRFVEEWLGPRSDLSWKGRRPFTDGHFSTPYRGRARDHGRSVSSITLCFDGRALIADPAWTEAIVDLLATLARQTSPFYAEGFTSEAFSKGGRIWYGSDWLRSPEREVAQKTLNEWMGLPSTATWLAWFGPPYRPLVEGSLPPERTTVFAEGVLLRLSEQPRSTEALRGWTDLLPRALRRDWTWLARSLMTSENYLIYPAEVIPPLD